MSKFSYSVGLVMSLALLAACSAADLGPSSTTQPTTTSTTAPTTSTIPAGPTLDLTNSVWVTHGPQGIHLDDGTLLWATQPFPSAIARDREGGLVFADSAGLWWFKPGADQPELVAETGAYEVVAVTSGPIGPVAIVPGLGTGYYDLVEGLPADTPAVVPVTMSSSEPWVTWTAANGLKAWITQPEVELDAENQVRRVIEPAHLVVAGSGGVLFDTRIAHPDEAWATIHDFDGERLIISRGPYEPAMPEESFLLVDLATGLATEIFKAGGTKATFTGPDSDWTGTVLAPVLGS